MSTWKSQLAATRGHARRVGWGAGIHTKRGVVLAALALAMVVAPIAPAGADHDTLLGPIFPTSGWNPYYYDSAWAWSNCSWNRESRSSLRVAQSTTYPFPNDNTAPDNGAPQSFRQRINSALTRWRTLYQGASPRPKSLTKVADGAENEILFQYRDPSSGLAGEVFVRRTQDSTVGNFGSRCPLHATSPRNQLHKVQVRIQKRSDWFTQPDSYVANWEKCTSASTYTCSKKVDFGSVVAHEFGHSFGLRHPEETTFGSAAGCATSDNDRGSPSQPTMCSFLPAWSGGMRTPELHDERTLHKHVEKNG